jgi:predicted DNA binding CopG/RHH family protein
MSKQKRITFRLDDSLYAKLLKTAKKKKIDWSKLIRNIIEKEIKSK